MPNLFVQTLIAVIIAYLFGSISSAIVTCKLMGLPDPRTQGSKNPGTTNVLRFGGKKAAAITLVGDVLKAVIIVLAAKLYGFKGVSLSLITLAVFMGHVYPLFFRFEGGKGVATAGGCLLALAWPVGCAVIVSWLLMAILFRYSSLAALVSAVCAPLYTWYFTANGNYTGMTVAMSLMLIFRHRKNIRNLFAGKEDKIGKRSAVPPLS